MKVTPQFLTFILSSAAVPILIVVLNFVVRGIKGWYYTSGTDFLLGQMTFSFSAAILWKDMAPYIHNEYIKDAGQGLFEMLGLVILVAWVWTVISVERPIHEAIQRGIKPSAWPQYKLFLAWTTVVAFFAAAIMPFVYP